MNKILNDLFYDPKFGLSSFENFKLKVKAMYPDIKISDIKLFYDNQEVNQLNKKPDFANLKNHMFKINGPELSFQIDLMFIPKDMITYKQKQEIAKSEGFIKASSLYIFLLCEDIISRKSYIYYLPDKTEPTIMSAYNKFLLDVKTDTEKFDKTLNYYERHQPFAIVTDDGFNFRSFIQLNQDLDILVDAKTASNDHITNGDRLGIIDRLVRTLKSMYTKFVYSQGSNRYSISKILNEIIENYNNTVHRSLFHHTPNQVFENKDHRMQIFNSNIEHNHNLLAVRDFNIGDTVRIYELKTIYEKEKPQFSKELYKIIDIKRGYKVYVENLLTHIPLKRGLKSYEMLKVNKDTIQRKSKLDVNKVIKANKKVTNQNKLLKQLDISNDNILDTKRIKINNPKYFLN